MIKKRALQELLEFALRSRDQRNDPEALSPEDCETLLQLIYEYQQHSHHQMSLVISGDSIQEIIDNLKQTIRQLAPRTTSAVMRFDDEVTVDLSKPTRNR